jgi:hypothetical protein
VADAGPHRDDVADVAKLQQHVLRPAAPRDRPDQSFYGNPLPIAVPHAAFRGHGRIARAAGAIDCQADGRDIVGMEEIEDRSPALLRGRAESSRRVVFERDPATVVSRNHWLWSAIHQCPVQLVDIQC